MRAEISVCLPECTAKRLDDPAKSFDQSGPDHSWDGIHPCAAARLQAHLFVRQAVC